MTDREPEPLTLEEIAVAHQRAVAIDPDNVLATAESMRLLIDEAVPQMLAELAHWRTYIPGARQYAVCFDPPSHAETWFLAESSGAAAHLVEEAGCGTAWVRAVLVGDWQPIADEEPPF